MKILLVSGFLGAGKTTFIKHLAQRTERDFVVFENEFGAENLDGKALKKENLDVWELTENCVCCTGKGEFTSSLLTIVGALDPEFLVVEPTGLARLGSLMELIQNLGYEKMELLPPVVLVDGVNFEQSIALDSRIFQDQIAHAEKILLTKTENFSEERIAAIASRMQEMQPSAELFSGNFEERDAVWWERFLITEESARIAQPGEEETEHWEQFAVKGARVRQIGEAVRFFEHLVRGDYGEILRVKGAMQCGSEPIAAHLVGGQWSIAGEVTEGDTCVFIGRDLKRQRIRHALGVLRSFRKMEKMTVSRQSSQI